MPAAALSTALTQESARWGKLISEQKIAAQ
jgi:hypothetical protein